MHKTLEFPAQRHIFEALRSSLVTAISPPWAFLPDRSVELSNEEATFAVFSYTGNAWPSADLFLVNFRTRASVSNIVPTSYGALSVLEYNAIFDLFYKDHLRGALQNLNIDVTPTLGERDISEWLSPASEAALRKFSSAANKSSGASYPSDRRRWNDFIIACHKANITLPVQVLLDWLTSEGRWPETVASDLVGEFENAVELLRAYDELT